MERSADYPNELFPGLSVGDSGPTARIDLAEKPQPRADDVESAPSGPLQRVASIIKSGKAKNIVLLLGAGISTSAGIPDFRSPDTGLYHNLQKLNLPFPEAVFELGFFKRRPEPFWTLAKELYPGKHFPTPTHYFLPLLHQHEVLRRVFTQNIDTLETLAGLPADRIVEAHGSFAKSHCLDCRREIDREGVLAAGVRTGQVVRCDGETGCGGLVKPDIVFFGEGLPDRFFKLIPELRRCDLLIVIGTSLQVQPFASLVDAVPSSCPRLLINREAVGPFSDLSSDDSTSLSSTLKGILRGKQKTVARDMYWEGDADEGVWQLVEALGWKGELEELIRAGRESLEAEYAKTEGAEVETKGHSTLEEDQSDAGRRAEKGADAVQEVLAGNEGSESDDELERAIKAQLRL
ncbi:hypothetical protein IAU60_006770 [Kwoniella sp. DSM 27419]